jgi:Ca2+-binding EF-hand superfamily protein
VDENLHDDWSYSSEDYSTDEEYLNIIAGAEVDEDEDEEERMKREFQLADVDHSGNISLSEFIKLSREMQGKAKNDTALREFAPGLSTRLDTLERKAEAHNKKLDRLCDLMEANLKIRKSSKL